MNDLTPLNHLEERLVESKMVITTGHNYYWTLRKCLKISSKLILLKLCNYNYLLID